MKKRLYKSILSLIIISFLTGCKMEPSEETNASLLVDNSEENVTQFIDDTYCVPDLHGILMLCEENEMTEYRENVQLLKGDKEAVEKAIKNLSAMEQTSAVLNAIGVGYLRLDKCDEGKEKLNVALSITKNNSEEACILNNLGNYRLCTPEDIANGNIASMYKQALEKESDFKHQIIIQMNQTIYGPLLYLNEKKPIDCALEKFQRLLEDEKRVLGSNQIVEIYLYPAFVLFLTEDKGEKIQYLEQAMKMNHERYRYRAADILIYQELMGEYHTMENYEKALEYADKLIETVDGFLSDSDPYLVVAYYDKARILIDEKRYDEATQCINILIEREDLRSNYRINSYLKLGEIYYLQDNFTKAEEMVQEAYGIFLTIKQEVGTSEVDISEMLKLYSNDDYNNGNPIYMVWLEEQLKNVRDK